MPANIRITIQAENPDQLREIVRREDLDLNCGGAKKTRDNEWVIEAYVSPEVLERLRQAGYRMKVDEELESRMEDRLSAVGDGDRFQGGRIPPSGIGRKE